MSEKKRQLTYSQKGETYKDRCERIRRDWKRIDGKLRVSGVDDHVPFYKQIKYRLRRIKKLGGITTKRVAAEAFVTYANFLAFVRNERGMESPGLDRVCRVLCHYEFILHLEETAEQARYRQLRKDRKRVKRKHD